MDDSRHQGIGCRTIFFLAFLLLSSISLARAGVNAWTSGGPYGGSINALAADSAGTIYAGTRGQGLFKSSDGGIHWAPISPGFSDFLWSRLLHINAIAIDASGTIYVGTGRYIDLFPAGRIAIYEGGIFKSEDGGESWHYASNMPDWVKAVVIDGSGIVYAGTDQGAYFSSDGGVSWHRFIPIGNVQPEDIRALAIDGSGQVYAGTYGHGVFKTIYSPDLGMRWVQVNTGLTNMNIYALTMDSDGTLYAGTDTDVFFLSDGGTIWSSISSGLTGRGVNALYVRGSGTLRTIYAGTSDGGVFTTYRFLNRWVPWIPKNEGLTDLNIHTLLIDSSGGIMYAGTDGLGVFRSSNGGESWQTASSGIPCPNVQTLAIEGSGAIYAGTYGAGAFKSSDGGTSWDSINSGITNMDISSLAADNLGGIFAGTSDGVFKSTNGGFSWTAVNSGITSYSYVDSLVSDSLGVVYAWVVLGNNETQLYLSTNRGASWTAANPSGTDWRALNLAVDGFGALYAGTRGGVFKSTNGGAGWIALCPGLIDPEVKVYALAVDASNPGTVYAGSWGGGVVKMTDGSPGCSNLGLSGQGIVSLLIRPDSGDLYAGTWGQGVLKSADGGENWEPFSEGLGNGNVSVLSMDPVDPTKIYAGTDRSVYQIQDTAPPTASFILTPFAPGISQVVTFQSTSTGGITEYLWDFGDGQQGSGSTAAHAYSAAGTFSVVLTTKGPAGTNTSNPLSVKVSKRPSKRLQVRLLGPSMGKEGSPLIYQAMVSNDIGSSPNYQFDWGDKVVTDWGPSSSALHSWNKAGKYRVKARVVGAQGKPSGWSRPLSISINNGSPVLSGAHDVKPNVPSLYTASPVSTANAPYSYSFSFDGGATWSAFSDDPTSSHSWPDGGTYCVKVKDSDKRGKLSPESDCFYVNVAFSNLPALPPTPDQGQ